MHWVIGELIAEGVVTRLFHSVGLRVISPRSTSALHDAKDLKKIKHHLGINFVFSGRYSSSSASRALSSPPCTSMSSRALSAVTPSLRMRPLL